MQYCLVTRKEDGTVSSVSESMSYSDCEDRKDLYVETGVDEESMEIVPNGSARSIKSSLTSRPKRYKE